MLRWMGLVWRVKDAGKARKDMVYLAFVSRYKREGVSID